MNNNKASFFSFVHSLCCGRSGYLGEPTSFRGKVSRLWTKPSASAGRITDDSMTSTNNHCRKQNRKQTNFWVTFSLEFNLTVFRICVVASCHSYTTPHSQEVKMPSSTTGERCNAAVSPESIYL